MKKKASVLVIGNIKSGVVIARAFGKLRLIICGLGCVLAIAINGTTFAQQVVFNEARGMLSRDYAMAQQVVSGATVTADGEYWLTLFDSSGRLVRNEVFNIVKPPVQKINSYSDCFESIKFALKNFTPQITLTMAQPDVAIDIIDVIKEVCAAYPSLTFGYQQSEITTTNYQGMITVECSFSYKFTRSDMVLMQKAVSEKTRSIIKSVVQARMIDYQVELAIHDYIVNNTRYDEINYKNNTVPAVDYTEYGALINGVAVCQGYAESTARLLGMSGIPALVIDGKGKSGELHAWNLVQIQNSYCHLDCTYDDPIGNTAELPIVSHDYFNLADKIIARDHRWVSSDYPRAATMNYSFYNLGYSTTDKNGNVYKKITNQQELQRAIAAAIAAHKSTLTVDLMNLNKTSYNLNEAFNQATNSITLTESIGCKFLYSDSPTLNVRHVRIELEYGAG